MKTIHLRALMSALALCVAPYHLLAAAAPAENFIPKDCSVIQKDQLLAGQSDDQAYAVALGQCGTIRKAWLLRKNKQQAIEAGQILDTIEIPAGKSGESVHLAGGACVVNGKPILKNIILVANWSGRSTISKGKGLTKIWLPDETRGRFTELPLHKVHCLSDQP